MFKGYFTYYNYTTAGKYYHKARLPRGILRGAKPLFLISSPSFEGEGDKGGEVDK